MTELRELLQAIEQAADRAEDVFWNGGEGGLAGYIDRVLALADELRTHPDRPPAGRDSLATAIGEAWEKANNPACAASSAEMYLLLMDLSSLVEPVPSTSPSSDRYVLQAVAGSAAGQFWCEPTHSTTALPSAATRYPSAHVALAAGRRLGFAWRAMAESSL